MWILYAIGFVWAALTLLGLLNKSHRSVGQDVPMCYLSRLIRQYSVRGRDHSRTLIYHKDTRILIEVTKNLSPDMAVDGIVELVVVKYRISQTYRNIRWGKLRLWPFPYPWPFRVRCVRYWRLPFSKKGEVLAEINCGASLARVEAVIQKIISEERGMQDNPRFDVWPENVSGGKDLGKFEEEIKESNKGASMGKTSPRLPPREPEQRQNL